MAKNVNCKNLVDVYMPISRDDAKRMGYKSSDICVRRIGVKNVTCIKTQGTPEFKTLRLEQNFARSAAWYLMVRVASGAALNATAVQSARSVWTISSPPTSRSLWSSLPRPSLMMTRPSTLQALQNPKPIS